MLTARASRAWGGRLARVHATGVGVRLHEGEPVGDDFVLKVYTFEDDLPEDRPGILRRFAGVDVDIERLPIQVALGRPPRRPPSIASHRVQRRPIPGGVFIAPLGVNYVGTLGCFVRSGRGARQRIFALSNNHVLADTNSLPLKTTRICQPGPETAPTKVGDVFALLSAFRRISFPGPNLFDAAIAEVISPSPQLIQTGSIYGIAQYNPTVLAAQPGMAVVKSGRSTGVTGGFVSAIAVNGVNVNYGTPAAPRIATFNNTIQIVGVGGRFSAPGDSGAVILERSSGQPIALLFAGSSSATTACDMAQVCTHFRVAPI
jgi:hypothetical protein